MWSRMQNLQKELFKRVIAVFVGAMSRGDDVHSDGWKRRLGLERGVAGARILVDHLRARYRRYTDRVVRCAYGRSHSQWQASVRLNVLAIERCAHAHGIDGALKAPRRPGVARGCNAEPKLKNVATSTNLEHA